MIPDNLQGALEPPLKVPNRLAQLLVPEEGLVAHERLPGSLNAQPLPDFGEEQRVVTLAQMPLLADPPEPLARDSSPEEVQLLVLGSLILMEMTVWEQPYSFLRLAAEFDVLAYRRKSTQSVYEFGDDQDLGESLLDVLLFGVGSGLILLLAAHQESLGQLAARD